MDYPYTSWLAAVKGEIGTEARPVGMAEFKELSDKDKADLKQWCIEANLCPNSQ
jgi:hypothetical protein